LIVWFIGCLLVIWSIIGFLNYPIRQMNGCLFGCLVGCLVG